MATMVARGRGKGIVVRTGNSTEIGRISQAITSTPHVKTSMEVNLATLGKWLVFIAVLLCGIIVVIEVINNTGPEPKSIQEILLIGLTLAVSVIPESLVAVVTVTMALGVNRMAQRHAIVRKLPAVESLGSVTVICSDKVEFLLFVVSN